MVKTSYQWNKTIYQGNEVQIFVMHFSFHFPHQDARRGNTSSSIEQLLTEDRERTDARVSTAPEGYFQVRIIHADT